MKYFWKEASGVNSDVERHRKEESYLREKIAELEQKEDEMSVAALRVYRNFLDKLLQSKAEAVSKLGR